MTDRERLQLSIRAFDQLDAATCGAAGPESIARQFGTTHALAIQSARQTIARLRPTTPPDGEGR